MISKVCLLPRRVIRSHAQKPWHFRFLDLPAEVRTIFYEHMFIKKQNRRDFDGVVHVSGYYFRNPPPLGDVYMWTHPLLRTNRQIREEGLDVFYKQNTFIFGLEWNMHLFLRDIGEFGRERIRSVRLSGLPRLWLGDESYDLQDWTSIENYLRLLAKLPNLRSLVVERSPFYFQERSIDEEDEETDTWYPDINTMDVDKALMSAYLGWLPLYVRGLKTFRIDWGLGTLTEFNAAQRKWFSEVDERIREIVTRPAPENYFQNRTSFLHDSDNGSGRIRARIVMRYLMDDLKSYWSRRNARRPSDFFSTYAFDPERYDHEQRWRKRRREVARHFSNRWWEVKHPRSTLRVWRWRWKRRSNAGGNIEDLFDDGFDPVILGSIAMPAALGPPVASSVGYVPTAPLHPPHITAAAHASWTADLQQGDRYPDASENASEAVLGRVGNATTAGLSPSNAETGSEDQQVDDDDDDNDSEILLTSLTDPRAASSLPSLLWALNMD